MFSELFKQRIHRKFTLPLTPGGYGKLIGSVLTIFATLALWAWFCPVVRAESWIFQPSYFSHDRTGYRVPQYIQPPEIPTAFAPNYMVSGYRHTRSTLRSQQSYDHLHIVKTWGLGEYIRPYEEWEFPFRPGATPFGPWGNPQGPWTLPFQSWVNPFALGNLPNPPWYLYYPGPVIPTPVIPTPPSVPSP